MTPVPDIEPGRLPMVFVERPRCPACRSTDLQTMRSKRLESDGSRTRYTTCRACSIRFVVIIE